MVEIIPKETQGEAVKFNIFLYISIFVLIVSVGAYFVLDNFLRKEKESLADLELRLATIMTPEKTALKNEIFAYEEKINNFSSVFNRHIFSSRVFDYLQKTAHPQVWFKNFNFSPSKAELSLSGETQNFRTLEEQINLFKEEVSIKSVKLNSLSISKEGKIVFGLGLYFNPEILKN